MKLYLVRHGEATSSDVDLTRPLTRKGGESSQQTGRRLRELGTRVAEVRHSVKVRAAQTAEIIAAELPDEPPLAGMLGLAPDDPPEPIAHDLHHLRGDVMIVGHMPFLFRLAALLLRDPEAEKKLVFPEAGLVILERDQAGRWTLAALNTTG